MRIWYLRCNWERYLNCKWEGNVSATNEKGYISIASEERSLNCKWKGYVLAASENMSLSCRWKEVCLSANEKVSIPPNKKSFTLSFLTLSSFRTTSWPDLWGSKKATYYDRFSHYIPSHEVITLCPISSFIRSLYISFQSSYIMCIQTV